MKVSFLIAGVQKGATTVLSRLVNAHPRVHIAKKKEVHFFDNDALDWSNPDYDAIYHIHFDPGAEDLHVGDATPSYIFWPPCISRIHTYNPEMKFIISLRDPIERAYSQWRMRTKNGGEKEGFTKAIRRDYRLLKSGQITAKQRQGFSYIERGFYASQLQRLYGMFPHDQVLVLEQKTLKSNKDVVLDRVCDHLGLDRFENYPVPRNAFSNKQGDEGPTVQDRAFLCDIFDAEMRRLKEMTGIDFTSDPPDRTTAKEQRSTTPR